MTEIITRYLEDAIAAEKSFESQLRDFAKEATIPTVQNMFNTHAEETRKQYELLTSRLQALGKRPSGIKSFLAHVFNLSPKTAQIGHDPSERTVQDLIMAFSVENAEVAMYESLIAACEAAADDETARIARQIQSQERETADKAWSEIAPAASKAFASVGMKGSTQPKDAVLRYLQDAEAAEQNFENALASFSKTGDQKDVQRLMSMMSQKARTQHERLEKRIKSLGGSRSVAKSMLAHMIAFSPVNAQMGHEPAEKNTQHLMFTYAAAAAEMGMYEALAVAAEAAGDQETAMLARQLQKEEKEDHMLAWKRLSQSARDAFHEVTAKSK